MAFGGRMPPEERQLIARGTPPSHDLRNMESNPPPAEGEMDTAEAPESKQPRPTAVDPVLRALAVNAENAEAASAVVADTRLKVPLAQAEDCILGILEDEDLVESPSSPEAGEGSEDGGAQAFLTMASPWEMPAEPPSAALPTVFGSEPGKGKE
eukprot:CAMPEP_0117684520 /NCGR_PEP_ID=MMETSP0804-20121206/21145_1 /TAXON_ID=1074897 /ORGANISM="Tetraselmis astigmatica, Strain CCMP880" /LENGTH=153 /DNA_ID=CAMNT_0005495521 /DNA_START=1 /DNA_END=461 /DNA_ORIENTATION=-